MAVMIAGAYCPHIDFVPKSLNSKQLAKRST
jgi:hypothetical protein